MERGAEVRARRAGSADDELTCLEALALLGGEAVDVPLAVGSQDEQPARREDAAELVSPRRLGILGEVREDGDRRDRPEAPVGVGQRRVWSALLATTECVARAAS